MIIYGKSKILREAIINAGYVDKISPNRRPEYIQVNPKPKINILATSKLIGLSNSALSKALSGTGKMSEKTFETIKKFLKDNHDIIIK
tara:strand:+ start:250 stop:513 length:264 start_codon:yes stop_codon:yes gene_type:complete